MDKRHSGGEDKGLWLSKKGLEAWNVCHRSGVALSALFCAVCRGGVECKLHENRGKEKDAGVEKLGVGGREGGRLKSRERMGAETSNGARWEKWLRGSEGRQRTPLIERKCSKRCPRAALKEES